MAIPSFKKTGIICIHISAEFYIEFYSVLYINKRDRYVNFFSAFFIFLIIFYDIICAYNYHALRINERKIMSHISTTQNFCLHSQIMFN